jgi:fatty acid desaturase
MTTIEWTDGARASQRTPWRSALSRPEVAELLELHDARSWLSLATNWGLVAASFAGVAAFPNPVSVVVALFVIGARQLGLAVLMHEAAHRTLLRDRRWNDLVGSWLCAYPVWSDLLAYRRYHLQHHAKNWTAEDPDIGLATKHPVTRASMLRKIGRDLSGRTGLKFARAAFARTFRRWRVDAHARRAARGVAITNLALLALLAACGRPELYLLWAGAWLTTNTFVTRIRSIAEHNMVPDPADPLRNTRTTLARVWERLLVAPNRVNFHLEHHLMMTVPHYHLPRMHRLLAERGALDGALVARGYPALLRAAASKPA